MRASSLRQHLAARIAQAASKFKLADSLIGVAAMPRTKLTPAFEVELRAATPIGDRQRSTATRVRRIFVVRLLHSGSPTKGIEQWDTCLDDETTARAALQARSERDDDPLACVENSIVYLGTDDPEILGGGEFRRSTLRFHIDFSEEI